MGHFRMFPNTENSGKFLRKINFRRKRKRNKNKERKNDDYKDKA
jgi:hypothetical protein